MRQVNDKSYALQVATIVYLVTLGSESFVFHIAIQKFKDQDI
jgi:hypothetical protein